MHTTRIRQRFTAGLGVLIVLSLLAVPATATHSWGNYHWARTSNPFTLQVGDNVSGAWDAHLLAAIGDWHASSVLDLEKVTGGAKSPKNCKATKGRIEVCNAAYGNNGWLGLAQIWVSGSHITQATAKQNDTYFNRAPYNTDAWRQTVICQEIAHDFGLDHQDENNNNANLGSCMDYTNDPDGGPGGASETDPSNMLPNQDDFDQLLAIYDPSFTGNPHTGSPTQGHIDTMTTIGASTRDTGAADEDIGNDPSNWGQVMRRDGQGRPSLYGKDLGRGEKVFTFVIYADETQDPAVDGGTGNDGNPDGGRGDGGKKDGGKKADGKKDGGKQRQGRHDKRNR